MNDNQIISILAVATAVVIVITLFMINPNTPNLPVIYIVYGSEKGDLSYTDCAYLGLFTAQESMPFIKQEFTSIDPDRFSGFLNGSGELKKPGFVITVGFQYAGDTLHFSQEHPETRFLAVDEAGIGSNNTKAYEVSSYGESYLAGVLAASATKTKRVGIILGMPSRPLEGFRLGYEAGVRAADPSVVLEEEYIGNTVSSFSDPKKGVEIADAMYRNGTDIIFTVAGYSGTGVIKAAKADSGRYVIGVDSDQTYLGPSVVIASAVKRVDRIVYSGTNEYLEGRFSGGNVTGGLNEGVTGIVFNPKFEAYNATINAWEKEARQAEEWYLALQK